MHASVRGGGKLTRGHSGFTLVELLAVILLLLLASLLLAPALARTKPDAQIIQCFNNARQLTVAWRMYAADSQDRIVYSSDDGKGSANPLNQFAWTLTHMDFSPANRSNWDPSLSAQSPLWPYCGRSPATWKCPADKSYVTVNGQQKPRIRSRSMNIFLGGFAGTDGGWPFLKSYRTYFKLSDLAVPGPAKVFVFLDMRPDSINWGSFMTAMDGYSPRNPSLYTFIDFPGFYHEGGCTFSYGDGHVELRHWVDPRTRPPVVIASSPFFSPRNPDVAWLQDHASRPK
jgi:prepilin-type N-terminal cleavage/methylation domain-containing protein/prepilin-type processing-associated H-X9-DG protein